MTYPKTISRVTCHISANHTLFLALNVLPTLPATQACKAEQLPPFYSVVPEDEWGKRRSPIFDDTPDGHAFEVCLLRVQLTCVHQSELFRTSVPWSYTRSRCCFHFSDFPLLSMEVKDTRHLDAGEPAKRVDSNVLHDTTDLVTAEESAGLVRVHNREDNCCQPLTLLK